MLFNSGYGSDICLTLKGMRELENTQKCYFDYNSLL